MPQAIPNSTNRTSRWGALSGSEAAKVSHANPMSEAPQVNKPVAWEPCIAKGRDALYQSARHRFIGNPDLSDTEVKVASDYMLKLITTFKGESK
jgi:cytochrome c5